jgi:hypothetical protein
MKILFRQRHSETGWHALEICNLIQLAEETGFRNSYCRLWRCIVVEFSTQCVENLSDSAQYAAVQASVAMSIAIEPIGTKNRAAACKPLRKSSRPA